MKQKTRMPDISSILYLALARKRYCNLYRFTMSMNEEVDPVLLQKALNQVKNRFSLFFCGFQPTLFHDIQTLYQKEVKVMKDTAMLKILSKTEIKNCPARVLYADKKISIEFFHALTDGYGAVAFISTLTAEYLKLRYHLDVPLNYPIMNINENVCEEEWCDEYLNHSSKKAAKLKKVLAYQLPREDKKESTIRVTEKNLSFSALKSISKHHGVSPTALLSALMAQTIMHVQKNEEKRMKPVRIMIPVNLRGFFPSCTFRNFIETIHVTLHEKDLHQPFSQRAQNFRAEMKEQLTAEHLSSLIKTHVAAQKSIFFRMIPRSLKYFAFKIGYALFGESNSSLTFTNLGRVNLPEIMHPYVEKIDCYLSPRTGSPYNCAMIAYRDHVSLNFSSFNRNNALEKHFFDTLDEIMNSVELSV